MHTNWAVEFTVRGKHWLKVFDRPYQAANYAARLRMENPKIETTLWDMVNGPCNRNRYFFP
jgi:hypothetical protein